MSAPELIYNNGEDLSSIAERILHSNESLKKTGITKQQIEECLTDLQGDELATTVVLKKYLVRNKEDRFIETTFSQAKNRWSHAISEIEYKKDWKSKKPPEYFRELYEYLIPGGRQMLALGNQHIPKASLSNCYTSKIEEDSLKGIFDAGYRIAKTFSYSGGQGIDLSPLRPNGALVSNTAKYSTGAVSFAPYFSEVSKIIGQKGRRSALILTLRIDHPDILEFIDLKTKNLDAVRYANISVKLTDDFMRSVETDGKVTLWFDTKHERIRKEVNAKAVWNKFISAARDCSEPGGLFWDTAVRESTSECYPELKIYNSNPCQPAEALLLTPSGITTMGEIKVGNIIWSGKKWTTVINKTMTGEKEVYEYKTAVGSFLGTNNHNVVSHGIKRQVSLIREIDSAPTYEGELSIPYKITNVIFKGVLRVYSITVEAEEHTYWTDGLLVGNCGEQIIDKESACCLASIILDKFVENPFTPQAQFNYSLFQEMVYRSVRHLDNIVEIGMDKHALPEQREKASLGRRIGLGITGLADTFASLGIEYGSDQSLEFSDSLFKIKRNTEYSTSIALAGERGPFPLFNPDKHYDCEFLQRLPEEVIQQGRKIGQRNVALSTIPPVGSGTIVVHRSGSGIEPTIFREYDRFVNLGKERKSYRVVSPGLLRYRLVNPDAGREEERRLFPQSDEIPWKQGIELQSVIQRYVDNAISRTVNLSKDVSYDTVSDIFMTAWKKGLKGITIYRENSREGVIVDASKEKDKNNPQEVMDTRAFKFRAEGGDKFYLHVSYRNGDMKKPYQVFITNYKAGDNDRFVKLGNDLRKKLEERKEVDSRKIEQQLERAENSLAKITRLLSLGLKYDRLEDVLSILEEHAFVGTLAKKLHEILSLSSEEEKPVVCPDCGGSNVVKKEGCATCMDCGTSKCS